MIDTILEKLKSALKSRLFPVTILFVILFAILINRIFVLQIVHGDEYEKKDDYRNEGERVIKSTRGNFYDRNKKLLAYNELSYTVTLEDTGELKTNDEKNAMIYKLIQIIERHNGTIASEFNITIDENGDLQFTGDEAAQLRLKKEVYSHRKVSELTQDERKANAKQVFEFLRYGKNKEKPSMFGISDKYSLEDALKIMRIRYAMFLQSYRKYIPITVAMNVDTKTVASIKENSAELPGVDILQETHRVYNDGKYFSNLLGYTGLVPQDSLEELNKKDSRKYCETDQIGKFGLEKVFEDQLHGKNGYDTLIINSSRRVVDVKEHVDQVAGNDIYLTIDAGLQKACYDLLEKRIAGIVVSKIRDTTERGSGKNLVIPIYDVYFALINNNIIDINNLNKDDSTNLERSVYNKFVEKRKNALRQLRSLLAASNRTPNKNASKEMEEYLNYIYSKILVNNKVIISDKVDSSDSKYQEYKNEKISLSEFLQYAISKTWIDLSKLNIENKFYTNEEVYNKLVDYITKALQKDREFTKRLYRYLIYSHELSGRDVCLLLYDQGVLKYKREEIAALQNGTISPYNFIIGKIRKLQITPGQLALEPCSGSVVVTDVNTGDVLALVTYPGYDNNKIANTADAEYFSKLSNDLATPMINRPLQQKTAPGSTFKAVSATAGLQEGAITPGTIIRCLGEFTKIGRPAKCHVWPSTHGPVSVAKALEVSCNYFFYEVGYQLSKDSTDKYNSDLGLGKLKKYAKMYGFDSTSGIELPEATPQISSEDSVRSAIGQGNHNYTPSQISRYATTIANGGKCFDLTLLDRIIDPQGKIKKEQKEKVHKTVDIAQQTWDEIHDGLYRVVNSSSSSLKSVFEPVKVKVAGKTGTAQESKVKPDHALFISYAPYDSPKISVTAVIPNGYTSANAAALASKIYQYYYKEGDKKDFFKKEADKVGASGRID